MFLFITTLIFMFISKLRFPKHVDSEKKTVEHVDSNNDSRKL